MSIRLCAEVMIRAAPEDVWQRILREASPELAETGSALQPEVIAREERSRLHLRHGKTPPLKQMDVIFSLSDQGGETRLTMHTHAQMPLGWLARLLYPFFRSRVEQYYVNGLNAIKADVEGLPDETLIPPDQRARMTRCP